jgi:very-short-patch-repair endonuclease
MSKVPKALSLGEEAFALHCRVDGLKPEREFRFHPERKWRFDFAWPEHKLAVEIEGLGGGRHQRMAGFKADCEKYNAALLQGWSVFRFTTDMVLSGQAINTVNEVLAAR